ncbi:MAG: T9SS type A sorting domain-containing protein [Bacteroidetes bacterium]|nr:T9SS type A sorting domain-containing protein [Bacteroidota bacterium]
MKKQIYLIILLLTCRICNAQNLVPNGDFEGYSGCPGGLNEIANAVPWFCPTSICSSDYFNQCSVNPFSGVPSNWSGDGYQFAHSGAGYSGVFLWHSGGTTSYREYIEVPFASALVAGQCYHFEMFINLFNPSGFASDDIGVYFSNTLLTGYNFYGTLPFTPQLNNTNGNMPDTLNWVSVNGNYIASGGESYLTIGNYKDDSQTTMTQINTSGYALTYIYIDDVCLTLCGSTCTTGLEEQNIKEEIKIYPNPLDNKLNITISNHEFSEIIIYDIASRKLLQEKFTNSISINTEQLAKGIYLYEVRNKNGVIKKGKVVKD